MAKGSTSARGRGQGTMITSNVPIGAALMTSRLPSWYRLTGVSSGGMGGGGGGMQLLGGAFSNHCPMCCFPHTRGLATLYFFHMRSRA